MYMKNNFPYNLKELRERKNISQSELAKLINVSRPTLSNYESGQSEPVLSNLIKLSNFFNCSIDELVFGLNAQKNLNKINYNTYSSQLETIINQLNRIDLSKIIKNIESIKADFNSDKEDFSQELSISSETIDKIINLDKHKLKNSIDIDFYKNNNLKICNSSYSNNNEQLSDIPFYRNISCGALKYTDGTIEDYFYINKNDLKYNKNDYFILQIDGESMNKLYKNGDYILIHKTKNYEGYKPYVFILGDEATLKYIDIDLENRNIILVPHSTDSSYQKQILKFEDLNSTNFGILGTVEGILNFID